MFSVDTVQKCGCDKKCSDYCILKCCVRCCVATTCPRHSSNISRHSSNISRYTTKMYHDNICDICSRYNEKNTMNNYLFLKNNKLVHYCSDCYNTYTEILNYLILTFTEDEQYDKFIIKYKDSEKAIKRYNEEIIIYNNMILEDAKEEKRKNRYLKKCRKIEEFLELYKNTVITEDILNNEIKTHKYYEYCDLTELEHSEYKYECPECNNVVSFDETDTCNGCNKILCDEYSKCSIMKTVLCSPNCNYCRNGCCRDGQIEIYCNACYVDDNLEFYNTYKDTIITSAILQEDIDKLDISILVDYNLKYECPICLITKDLKLNLIRECDRCDEYICYDCSIIKNNGCSYYNCRFCNAGTCLNASTENICNNCYRDDDESESESDSDEEVINVKTRCNSICSPPLNGEPECNICYINEKKYACVPCGHFCMCGQCANRIVDKCPICKDKIDDIIKIYM